jgi:hypothetical protein
MIQRYSAGQRASLTKCFEWIETLFWFQAVDEKDKVMAVPRIAIHM